MTVERRSVVAAAALLVLLMPTLAQHAPGTFKYCPDCPELMVIPAGHFLMGSKASWIKWFNNYQDSANEKPQHRVTVKSFALGKFEMTQSQWIALMTDNPNANKGADFPVEQVSWNDV